MSIDIRKIDDNEPFVSVIVPVFNVKDYLPKCIDSILNQTFSNFELILVDDGSTDESGMICDDYALKDGRIKVIHKENGGLSDARNCAIDVMKGNFVTFIDSDDYVTSDYLSYLLSNIIEYDADISMCQLKKMYKESDGLNSIDEQIEVLDCESAIECYLYQKKFTASAHCKMYKSSLFEKMRYPVGYYYEDMAIICDLLQLCSKVVVSNVQKYFYIQRATSIMGESFNPKKMHRIEIAELIRNDISSKYYGLTGAAEVRCFLAAVQTLREIPKESSYVRYVNQCWEIVKRYRQKVIFDKKAKIFHRMIAFSSYAGLRFLRFEGKLFSKMRY